MAPRNQGELFVAHVQIVPARLRRAREMRGLTQAELADRARVDQSHIAMLETGQRQPSHPVLNAVAESLGLPAEYFKEPVRIPISEGTLRYRAKASLGRKMSARIRSEAEHYLDLIALVSEKVNSVPVKIDVTEASPVDASQEVRKLMGSTPSEPLHHLIRHIEKLGCIVLVLGPYNSFDAFADWGGPTRKLPFIAVAQGVSADRLRMNVAHELGHLVLHKDSTATGKEPENEAFTFAAELLMPADGIVDDLRLAGTSLDSMISLKAKWGVSIQALAKRSSELGVTTARQFRTMMMRINKLGWKFDEPGAVWPEQALALRKMVEVGFGDPISYREIAAITQIPPLEIKQFLDRYTSSSQRSAERLDPFGAFEPVTHRLQ